ncbi:GNAT family N-acetyltransferase [Neorhizobium sp. P12A]|uniref:GNAT family N-acetyltransferase n=1 Tax=Neorhizobium sp. P12A TaxID=2268027 RepID=UPI0032B15D02
MTLVILIGASGSGKTTLAKAVSERWRDEIDVLHFDSIGVPPVEEMIAVHGSPEAWQRAATVEWMRRLADMAKDGRHILFEGQTRLSFLAEGAAAAGVLPYVPILVDCDDATRTRRLSVDRAQPELANPDMMNWAAYLRAEAQQSGCEIFDTSDRGLEDCLAYLLERFRSPASPVSDNVSEPEIRRADVADADAIRELTRAAYTKWVPLIGREPLPMTADYEQAVRHHLIDLLYAGNELAALIELVPDEGHLLIENVAVSPRFQGRGYGRRLMRHAEDVAAGLKLPEIKLYTNQLFAENVALYRKLGYSVDREEPFKGGVIVHMSKHLPYNE